MRSKAVVLVEPNSEPFEIPGVLVTIPVHNEAGRIQQTVKRVREVLDRDSVPYLLSIAEDASTDGTLEILKQIQLESPDIIIRARPAGRGRGSALTGLWVEVKARAYAYVDADLAMGPGPVARCMQMVLSGEASAVTASRYCPGATVRRPPLVHAVSRTYNRLIRQIFNDGVFDHQCGLKVFSGPLISQLLPLVRDKGWFWDTEMLVLSSAAGYQVAEVPVDWQETKNSRTSWRRLVDEIPRFLAAILFLKGSIRHALKENEVSRNVDNGSGTISRGTQSALKGGLNENQ